MSGGLTSEVDGGTRRAGLGRALGRVTGLVGLVLFPVVVWLCITSGYEGIPIAVRVGVLVLPPLDWLASWLAGPSGPTTGEDDQRQVARRRNW